jgi:catechol 2,3-dioxygenase-like lactoylglutathione lyase family enzyme
MSSERGFQVRALGEIAIRCIDLGKMTAFYREIIGLQILPGGYRDGIVFFRIAEGFGGHTCVLALFQDTGDSPSRAGQPSGDSTTKPSREFNSLHHLALSLPFSEQEAVMRWFDQHRQPYQVEHFGWIGWRGVFTRDPEGNSVELVAFDPSLLAPPAEG